MNRGNQALEGSTTIAPGHTTEGGAWTVKAARSWLPNNPQGCIDPGSCRVRICARSVLLGSRSIRYRGKAPAKSSARFLTPDSELRQGAPGETSGARVSLALLNRLQSAKSAGCPCPKRRGSL